MAVFERKAPATDPVRDAAHDFLVQTLAKVAAGANAPRSELTPAALNGAFRAPLTIPPEET